LMKLFLCGDVMTGRGIDQILRYPCAPQLYEPYMTDAREYVRLVERASGPVPRAVDDAYVWGDALEELERARPDARIINLETAVTQSEDWVQKGINYRMHPANVGCLTVARTDCCALANNHLLDWDRAGLIETLETLARVGIHTTGAGRNRDEAETPARLGRVLVYAVGCEDSGIPPSWAAGPDCPGIDFLGDLSSQAAERLTQRVRAARLPGDVVVVSIHWGGNWGYRVPREQSAFAHRLIDSGAADVIHGHSSHHPKAIEIYRGKLVLYGCGDFINDYEGISGHDEFRGDLGLMYFPRLDATSGELVELELVALCRRRLRLERASETDAAWLCGVLNKEAERFGVSFARSASHRLRLVLPARSRAVSRPLPA
jgi:poly-gamma-glutamate capsule biosynthesis protein CapA/YwtB (metallophosphatase superfamily)